MSLPIKAIKKTKKKKIYQFESNYCQTFHSLKDYQNELKRLIAENKLLREKNESLIRDNEMLKAQLSSAKVEPDASNL